MKVPERPCDIHPALSKYKSWRKYQRETIQEILESFESYDYIFLNAPTGSGKSLIAISTALLMGGKTYITTETIGLQNQYKKDFPSIVEVLKGRANYPCPKTGGTGQHCVYTNLNKLGEEFKAKICCEYKDTNSCPYRCDKEKFKQSKIGILNNHLYLYMMNYNTDLPLADFTIFDEGHVLEGVLMDFITLTISDKTLKKFENITTIKRYLERLSEREKKEFEAGVLERGIEFLTYIQEQINLEIKKLEEELNDIIEKGADYTDKYKKLSEDLEEIQGLQGKISYMLNNITRERWIMDFNKKTMTLKFKPLYVKKFKHKLFRSKKNLVMSATMTKNYGEFLGLDSDEYLYIEIPSTFPPQNRPFILIPRADMRYDSGKEKDRDLLVKCIDKVLDIHKDERGIIHSVTYNLAKYIQENIAERHKKRLLVIPSSKKIKEYLEIHKETEGSVLVSPSIHTGFDFKYDLARFQVITKIPYPNLGDRQIKERKNVDKAWYITQAVMTLTQAYGRANRAEDDRAVTYIFDRRIRNIIYDRNYREIFPKWFRDAFVDYDKLEYCKILSDEEKAFLKSVWRG